MKTYIFRGGMIRKKLVRPPAIPCLVCGTPTKPIAFFDLGEVYLYGECPADEAHGNMEHPWPTRPLDRMLSPHNAEQLGYEVAQ